MTKNNEPHPYKKPPLWVQILLWAYGFMWLNMIFVTGLNSLYLGYIDYDSGSIAFAMTCGFCRACFKRGNLSWSNGIFMTVNAVLPDGQ